MDDVKKRTIQYYNQNADLFTSDTISANMNQMCEVFMKYVPEGHILDLGCGSGRDAKYFINHGYTVTAVDGSEELCKIAEANIRQPVRCILFDELDYAVVFEGVWACASLLHCTKEELPSILIKVRDSLKPGAFFYASFKYGDYEGDRNGRFYTDWNEESFESLLNQVEGLEIVDTVKTMDVRPGRGEEYWLNVFMKKVIHLSDL